MCDTGCSGGGLILAGRGLILGWPHVARAPILCHPLSRDGATPRLWPVDGLADVSIGVNRCVVRRLFGASFDSRVGPISRVALSSFRCHMDAPVQERYPCWTERYSSGPVHRLWIRPVHEWLGERTVRELGESRIPAEAPLHSRRLILPPRTPRVARPLGRRVQLVGGGDTADSP